MTEPIEWNERYRDGNLPWDTGRPSSELERVLREHPDIAVPRTRHRLRHGDQLCLARPAGF